MEIEKQQKPVKGSKLEAQYYDALEPLTDKQIGTYFSTDTHKTKDTRPSKPLGESKCRFCGAKHKDSQCTRYSSGADRIKRLKELQLCSRCMGTHQTKSCLVTLQTCRKCHRGKHYTLLCKTYDKPMTSYSSKTSTNDTPENLPTNDIGHINVSLNATVNQASGSALATAKAMLESGEEVRLFFDQGSQKIFITRRLVERTNMAIRSTQNMTLQGFMGKPNSNVYQIVRPKIRMGNRKKRITAVVVDDLPQCIKTTGLSKTIEKLTRRGIRLADPNVTNDKVGPVDILIGSDHFYDLISLHVIKKEGIRLLKSPSGYLITDKIPEDCKGSTLNNSIPTIPESVIVMKITNPLDSLGDTETKMEHLPMHRLWDLDVIGIDPTQPIPENRAAYQDYLDTVRYEEGQYWVKLPWKVNKPDLPNNYHRSLGQMHSLVKELNKKGLVEAYDGILKEQLDKGFIEEVPDAWPKNYSHYLPHHGVLKESATTPLRIVFNCSSKASQQAPSLNDCLMTGQNFTRKLGDLLLSFRTGKYAYSADISKAFLRIGLQEPERDYTLFLWPSNPQEVNGQVKTYRFRSVLFGATSSPFLLQATLDNHLRKSTSPLKEILASNFYVDNLLGTTTDEGLLRNIYSEANKKLQLANMPLRQWSSNNMMLKALIEEEFPDYQVPKLSSILGLERDTERDTLALETVKYSQTKLQHMTKRLLLAQVSKLFDPIGLFSPLTIRGKLLLQESWKLKLGWDDPLPDSFIEEWKILKDEYQQASKFTIPRVTAT